MGKFAWVRLMALVLVAGCVALLTGDRDPGAASAAAESSLIANVPHVHQKPDFCGEACVASWLQKLGIQADQDDVFNISGLDPAQGRGCYTKELARALQNIGFQPGPIWNRIPVAQHDKHLNRLWLAMVDDLNDDVPSIICMRTGEGANASEHFRLVLGYDASKDEVVYHEPATNNGSYHRMSRTELLRLWPLKYSSREWTVIRMALRADRKLSIPSQAGYSDADFAQHIMALKKRLPNQDFNILVEPPFVVVSDDTPRRTKRRAEQTVRWATTKLKEAYFSKDPNQILDIWLFKDKTSYDTNTLRIFGSQPTTPYGYYSSTDGALVMNIATGGGTLVHEIVHPFIESNFPACPAWLNEGLGSLYEQSASRNGNIVGLTNWRLAGLQRAIKRDVVPSFGELCSTTTHQFYRADPGTNYAQARYLCYYLQEH
ncbi:MAG: C39 family peptidase, partial [Pirellulales bacterium]|nr:C39 family peptidase [Pirellulales bacterium]